MRYGFMRRGQGKIVRIYGTAKGMPEDIKIIVFISLTLEFVRNYISFLD